AVLLPRLAVPPGGLEQSGQPTPRPGEVHPVRGLRGRPVRQLLPQADGAPAGLLRLPGPAGLLAQQGEGGVLRRQALLVRRGGGPRRGQLLPEVEREAVRLLGLGRPPGPLERVAQAVPVVGQGVLIPETLRLAGQRLLATGHAVAEGLLRLA